MIKAIIFDMDGVMIDTERQSTEGWLHAFAAHGGEIPMWLVNKFKGAPAELSAKYFDEYFKGEYDYWQMRQERTDYIYKIRKTKGVAVKHGLYTLLEAIRIRELKCAVATSTRRESAVNSLTEIGAMSYLDAVVYGDEVEHGKPEPDIFLKAAEIIGVEPSECIVIEDSINGIRAAHAAGMRVVHIPDTIDIYEHDERVKELNRCAAGNEMLGKADTERVENQELCKQGDEFAGSNVYDSDGDSKHEQPVVPLCDVICRDLSQVVTVMDYWNGRNIRIDRQRVIDTFDRYTSAYDLEDTKIKLKYDHTFRVANLCQCIAESLGLSEEDTDIAWLTGILHDIGRFEQIRRYGTFSDADSVNHGELGANILFNDGLIANFVPELDDMRGLELWNILEHAIRWHSIYRVPEDIDEREKMFAHILRDADKIDILKVNYDVGVENIYNVPRKEVVSRAVTSEVMEDFAGEHAVLRHLKKTPIDHVVGHISLVFELVYPVSLELALSQGYLERLMNYPVENEEAKRQFGEIRGIMEKFIDRRLASGNF